MQHEFSVCYVFDEREHVLLEYKIIHTFITNPPQKVKNQRYFADINGRNKDVVKGRKEPTLVITAFFLRFSYIF